MFPLPLLLAGLPAALDAAGAATAGTALTAGLATGLGAAGAAGLAAAAPATTMAAAGMAAPAMASGLASLAPAAASMTAPAAAGAAGAGAVGLGSLASGFSPMATSAALPSITAPASAAANSVLPAATAAPAATIAGGAPAITGAALSPTTAMGSATPALGAASKGLLSGGLGSLMSPDKLLPMMMLGSMFHSGGSAASSDDGGAPANAGNEKYKGGNARFPGPGYRPGVSPEFNYFPHMMRTFSNGGQVRSDSDHPYATDMPHSINDFRSIKMNKDGTYDVDVGNQTITVPSLDSYGMSHFQKIVPHYANGGDINDPTQDPSDVSSALDTSGLPNEGAVVQNAIAAIQGHSHNPEGAIRQFLMVYGPKAFEQLVADVKVQGRGVKSRDPGKAAVVSGPGDGGNDQIPASLQGKRDVMLSDGEYIVPSDVVSGIGNGSTEAGASRLGQMTARVRMAKTGNSKQPPQVDPNSMLPA